MYCANFTPLIPLRSYSSNNASRRSRDTSTRPRASRLKICPASSAANVMKFFYDISASSDSGARRDAYKDRVVQHFQLDASELLISFVDGSTLTVTIAECNSPPLLAQDRCKWLLTD